MDMASKLSLFLFLNLLIFSLVSAHGGDKCATGCSPPTPKKPSPTTPKEPSPTTPITADKCPINALKLGVCADLLKHLVKIKLGEPPVKPCCSLIKDLVDVEAALCLCTAIKQSSVLGIKLDVPLSLSLLLNVCGKKAPSGFQCPE